MQLGLDIYIWCLFQVFIFLKFFSNTGLQLVGRTKGPTYDYPEDKNLMGKGQPSRPDSMVLSRARNLWRNDLENLVPMNFLALAAALVQTTVAIYIVILCLFILFRLTHAFSMMTATQPFRTLSYLAGVGCQLALVVLICIRLGVIFQTF